MLRSSALVFPLVLTACSLAVGPAPAPSNPTQPARPGITVTPVHPSDPSTPKPADAQTPQAADTTPHLKPVDLDGRQNLSDGTKMQLIRVMDADFVHVRKNLPVGEKDLVIGPDGMVKPGDAQLYRMAQ